MSQLLDFYRQEGTDAAGRRLADLWAWDDEALEEVHDFIQWLFPLPERSAFNPAAPLLTPEDIAAFRTEPAPRSHLLRSFERILTFLGLAWEEGMVVEGPNFAARVPDVWAGFNHNWLRITRILRSLTLLGLADQAQALYAWLADAHQRARFPIPPDTFRYWTEALRT